MVFSRRYSIALIGLGFVALSSALLVRHVSAQTGTYPIVNYGATCNGVADDAPAIRLAIDAAGKAGGGTITFPDNSTCVIASEIKVMANNIHLLGVGDGRLDETGSGEATTALDYSAAGSKPGQSRIIINTALKLRMPANHPLINQPSLAGAFDVSGDNFSASKLRFVGPRIWYKDGADPAHDGKVFTAKKKILIENTTFDGVGYALIRGGEEMNLTFANNICVNWGRTCVGANKNTVIRDSVFRQTGIGWDGTNPNQPAADRWSEYATYVYAMSSSGEYNFTFENNIAEGLRAGVQVNGGAQGYQPRGFTITHNTFRGNYDSIIGSDFGGGGRWENVKIINNAFDSDLRNSIYIYKGQDITIENNSFRGTDDKTNTVIKSGVRFMTHQDDTDLGYVDVRNNTFNANGAINWSGVTMYEQGGYRLTLLPKKVYDITIENNKFLNQGATRYGAGVYLIRSDIGRVDTVAVNCNTFTSMPEAGGVDATAYVRLGSDEGSKLPMYAANVTLTNNTFTGNDQAKLYGVYSQNGSRIDGGTIANNAFSRFASQRDIAVTTNDVATTLGQPVNTCSAGVPGNITLGASLAKAQTGPAPTPTATAIATTAPVGSASIVATKVVDKESVKAGDVITYTTTFTNQGSGVATNITVTDRLDPNLVYEGSSDEGSAANGTVTWHLSDLATGASKSITLQARVR